MFNVRFKGTKEAHTVLAVSRDANGTWFLIYREGRWVWVDANSFRLAGDDRKNKIPRANVRPVAKGYSDES